MGTLVPKRRREVASGIPAETVGFQMPRRRAGERRLEINWTTVIHFAVGAALIIWAFLN
jgi:hypothetical protein